MLTPAAPWHGEGEENSSCHVPQPRSFLASSPLVTQSLESARAAARPVTQPKQGGFLLKLRDPVKYRERRSSSVQNSPSLSSQLNLLLFEGHQISSHHPYPHRRAGGRRRQQEFVRGSGGRKQPHRVRKYTEFAALWEDVDESGLGCHRHVF